MRATPSPFSPPSSRASRRDGFALLITIVLVAFLVLLLVGLATFTRVETQVATNSVDLAKARQNALFALNLAVGKLQQAAGPDQRVTATGEVVAGVNVANRKWTAAWDTTGPAAQAPSWLVSGAVPAPGTAPSLPATALFSSSEVRLVGPRSSTNVVGESVVVPLQDIRSAAVPGLDPAAVPAHLIGRFGFWVGDEGVKARANLENPFTSPWLPDASVTAATRLHAGTLAQRSAFERITGATAGSSFADSLPADDDARDAVFALLDRWVQPGQISFLADSSVPGNAAAMTDAARARFHDISVFSAGVQADVRLGGLKRDLTAAFEMDDTAFESSVFGTAAPAAERATLPVNRLAGLVFSPIVGSGSDRYRGPTWHLLRNHYRLYREFTDLSSANPVINGRRAEPATTNTPYLDIYNGSSVNSDPKIADTVSKGGGAAQPTPRATAPALIPYVNRITIVFSLQTVPTGSTSPDGVAIYSARVVMTPYVVLHNPYAVRLNLVGAGTPSRWARLQLRGLPFDQIVRVSNGGTNHDYTSRTGSDANRAIPLLLAAEALGGGIGYNNFMNIYLPGMVLEPGEVRVFSADLTATVPVGNSLDLTANAYFSSGFYLDRLNLNRTGFFGQDHAQVSCPIGVGGALVPATDDFAKVRADWNLSLALYAATKTGDNNNLIVRYHARTLAGDNLASDNTMHSELFVRGPELGGGTVAAETRTYSGYNTFEGFRGGNLASTYTGTPTPMFAYDVFVKPADHDAAYAVRPFVTSSPLAIVTGRDSLGDWPAKGHSLVQPVWQPRYRTLSPNAWSENSVIAVDAGGNGRAYWGPSNTDAGLQQVSVLGVPQSPMTSIAQFQHLNLAYYTNQPAMAVGNSLATPFSSPTVSLENPRKGGIDWWHADLSYLANEALWDRCFFSTLAPGFAGPGFYTGNVASDANSRQSVRDAWRSGTRALPNARVQPYDSPNFTAAQEQTRLLDPERAASHLLVTGAFNINSRSIEAWTALLSSARSIALLRQGGSVDAVGDDNAVARSLPSRGGARSGGAADLWSGYARLTDAQIASLAQEIVNQVAVRQTTNGRPFFSLAEFVNRRVANPVAADATLHRRGAIQAALEATNINNGIAGTDVDGTTQSSFPYPAHGHGKASSAASGFVSQADILQQIGPVLSARSDTFVVRTYGEVVNPVIDSAGAAPIARVWCEAVVQRTPDYVDPSNSPETALTDATLTTENRNFGRRFRVVSFRWLGPDDI